MPIPDLFNKVSLNQAVPVANLDIVRSNDHNSLLSEIRDKLEFIQDSTNTATGGTGIETQYIANSAINSSKINLQFGTPFLTTNEIVLPSVQGAGSPFNTNSVQPNGLAPFSIIWEKPNMTAIVWVKAVVSCLFSGSASPNYSDEFIASLYIQAQIPGWTLIDTKPFSDTNSLYNTRITASFNFTGNKLVNSILVPFYYTNTIGQPSTNFRFSVAGNNLNGFNGAFCTPAIKIQEVYYQTYNQIHA